MLKEIIYTFRGKKGVPAREPLKVTQEVPRVSELDLTNSQVVSFLDSLVEGVFTAFYKEACVEAGQSVDNASIMEVIADYLSDGRSGVAAERFAQFEKSARAERAERQASARFEYALYFIDSAEIIGNVFQHFRTNYLIKTGIGKRQLQGVGAGEMKIFFGIFCSEKRLGAFCSGA